MCQHRQLDAKSGFKPMLRLTLVQLGLELSLKPGVRQLTNGIHYNEMADDTACLDGLLPFWFTCPLAKYILLLLYRTGPIHFLARWRKRRAEPGFIFDRFGFACIC